MAPLTDAVDQRGDPDALLLLPEILVELEDVRLDLRMIDWRSAIFATSSASIAVSSWSAAPPTVSTRSRSVSDADCASAARRSSSSRTSISPSISSSRSERRRFEVLDLVLDRFELLGVHDAAVVEPFVLCGGLLRERVDLVLELGLVATDHVELQPKLPQRTLGGVSLVARGGELAPDSSTFLRALRRSIVVSISCNASNLAMSIGAEA